MKQIIALITLSLPLLVACSKKPEEAIAAVNEKYIYVASGLCYSGGLTTFTTATASNLVYRIKASNAQKDITIADYNAFPANSGDSPVGVLSLSNTQVGLLVENTTSGRRIETTVKSSQLARSLFTANTTILSAGLRGMQLLSDGSFLINKTSSLEKVTSSGIRIGAPLVGNNLGATCGASITGLTATATLSNGKIIFTHAVAANNRFGIIASTGYSVAGDCLAAQAAPVATAFPTATVYIPSVRQLIVAYAGASGVVGNNSLYVYDIDETTNAITNATKIYDAMSYPTTYNYLLFGISAMTFDLTTNELYIATAVSTAATVVNYAIEKLTYDSTAKTLTRTGSTPFYNYGVDTKCISAMTIAN